MLIDRLITKIKELSAPIVVGLDPRLDEIPGCIKNEIFAAKGRTPQAAADVIYAFYCAIIDQIYDVVPAVKPQVALYEQFGVPGMDAYFRTIAYAKTKGLIAIGDIKRGDIASTAQAYSNAHIGRVSIEGEDVEISQTDFITLNPYMGYDSIEPYLQDCKRYDKGLFVLVKTSNPGSGDIQDLMLQSGSTIYTQVGRKVIDWGRSLIGQCGYSNVGAVVGATHPSQALELRKLLPHVFFLVPGYGAQGGSGKDLKDLWAENFGAIVNSSRGITGAYRAEKYKGTFDEPDFAKASRQAALDMKADLWEYMPWN